MRVAPCDQMLRAKSVHSGCGRDSQSQVQERRYFMLIRRTFLDLVHKLAV